MPFVLPLSLTTIRASNVEKTATAVGVGLVGGNITAGNVNETAGPPDDPPHRGPARHGFTRCPVPARRVRPRRRALVRFRASSCFRAPNSVDYRGTAPGLNGEGATSPLESPCPRSLVHPSPAAMEPSHEDREDVGVEVGHLAGCRAAMELGHEDREDSRTPDMAGS
jgi:hypothetical protein